MFKQWNIFVVFEREEAFSGTVQLFIPDYVTMWYIFIVSSLKGSVCDWSKQPANPKFV